MAEMGRSGNSHGFLSIQNQCFSDKLRMKIKAEQIFPLFLWLCVCIVIVYLCICVCIYVFVFVFMYLCVCSAYLRPRQIQFGGFLVWSVSLECTTNWLSDITHNHDCVYFQLFLPKLLSTPFCGSNMVVNTFPFCETQPPPSIGWVALSSVFVVWSFGRPASVTSPLISTIWCFRAYKLNIFCEDMILQAWQHVSVNISSVAELSPVYCCLVMIKNGFSHLQMYCVQ